MLEMRWGRSVLCYRSVWLPSLGEYCRGRWTNVIILAATAVPSSSQTKEADPQLTMGPSGRGFGDFPYL